MNEDKIRTYDELNRVTSCTDYKGNTVKYSYDELGNLISLTYPGGEIVRYEYYANGNLNNNNLEINLSTPIYYTNTSNTRERLEVDITALCRSLAGIHSHH